MSIPKYQEQWAEEIAALHQGALLSSVLSTARNAGSLSVEGAQKLWQLTLRANDRRRASGVYYTASKAADLLVSTALESLDTPPQRVLEPSCGGGTLVSALIRALTQRYGWTPTDAAARIHAHELDENGLWLAKWQVLEDHGKEAMEAVRWQLGDSLQHEALREHRYDLIFGNPPFGNAIERSTRRSTEARARFQKDFPLAARGAFDKCALFVELAAQCMAETGVLSYILPRSWLSQPASSKLRAQLAKDFDVVEVRDLAEDAFFAANVSTVGVTLRKRGVGERARSSRVIQQGKVRQLPSPSLFLQGNWGAALHPFTPEAYRLREALVPLTSVVEISAGATTEEAYLWKPDVYDMVSTVAFPRTALESTHASDPSKAPEAKPLIIAGMVEPFEFLWGQETTRYLGDDYLRPMLPLHALRPKRRGLSDRPRALLPTLSRALEASPDLQGTVIGAVSTIAVWPISTQDSGAILALCAILNSSWCRMSYAALFSALALHGGNTQVTKNKLAELYIPLAWTALLQSPLPTPKEEDKEALQRTLNTLTAALSLTLDKGLPSTAQMQTLRQWGRKVQSEHNENQRIQLLSAALHHQPKQRLERGVLDVLLYSFAPELTRLDNEDQHAPIASIEASPRIR